MNGYGFTSRMMDPSNWTAEVVLVWALIVLVVIATIYVVVRAMGTDRSGSSGSRDGESSAAEVLEKRFASGEISEEEFKRRRSMLADR